MKSSKHHQASQIQSTQVYNYTHHTTRLISIPWEAAHIYPSWQNSLPYQRAGQKWIFICYELMEWQWLLVPPNTFQRLLRLLSFHCPWIEAIPAALDAHCAIDTSQESLFRWFAWICAHIHMAGCEYWLIPGIWYWYKETWSQQTDWSLHCPCVWWSCLIYMLVFCSLPVCMGLWWDSHFKPQPLHSQSAWMGWVMSKLTCLVYWDLSLE